tara:strand:+ start:14496 stop:14765 length:270 start_codon:yes stop_codon:yes gene_type:complete
MKVRVAQLQGLTPGFTVTLDQDSDFAFKGGSELRITGSQSALPLPYGTTQQFNDVIIDRSPNRGYVNGQLRFNTGSNKLEVFNNGIWSG